MFERFSDRARQVLVLAREEARLLSHNFIGTEHILLGLLAEGEGGAAHALAALGVTVGAARAAVEEAIGPVASPPMGSPPFTPRAKKVLELSLREALQLGHNDIDTEHLLLAVVQEGEGVAAQVLVSLGVDLARVRQEVIRRLPEGSGPVERRVPTVGATTAIAAAGRFAGSDPMGTHHLLLALFDSDMSLAAKVLTSLKVNRAAVERLIQEHGVGGTTDETALEGRALAAEVPHLFWIRNDPPRPSARVWAPATSRRLVAAAVHAVARATDRLARRWPRDL